MKLYGYRKANTYPSIYGSYGSLEKEMREWWNDKDYLRYIPEKAITEYMTADDIINMILHDIGRDELLTDNSNDPKLSTKDGYYG